MIKLDRAFHQKLNKEIRVWWLVVLGLTVLLISGSIWILSLVPSLGKNLSFGLNIGLSLVILMGVDLLISNPILKKIRINRFIETHKPNKTVQFTLLTIYPSPVTIEKVAFYELEVLMDQTHVKVCIPTVVDINQLLQNQVYQADMCDRFVMGVSHA